MALMRAARLHSLVLSLAASFVLTGCSSDSAQRTAFEALQNVNQEDCQKLPSVECPKRESYDDYQRERKKLESK
jgi:outer membrane biogenesis lipoprotein LolB